MSKYPSIPDPTDDPRALRESVAAIKQIIEILTAGRANPGDLVATQQDIINLSSAVDLLATVDLVMHIAAPANQDYVLDEKLATALNILETTVRTGAGTATVTPKVNTTALGGSANSATTTQSTIKRTTSNTGKIGDRVLFTVSAVSGCSNLVVTFKCFRIVR